MPTHDTIHVSLALAEGGEALSFAVENRGDRPFKFCMYHTPFEGFYSDMLEVVGPDGAPVEFTGILAKRAEPTEEDYRTLAAGERATAEMTLAELAENYEMARPGTYRVRFVGNADINGLPSSNVVDVKR